MSLLSPLRQYWRLAFLLLIVAFLTVDPLFSRMSPTSANIVDRLAAPFWLGGDGLLGRDHLGRDILARIVYGGRVSILAGVSAAAIAATLGTALGLLAGFYGGLLDDVLMRVADVQQSLPLIVLAIAIVAVAGSGLRNVILVLGFAGWVLFARVLRGDIMSLKERNFVEAARTTGATDSRIIFRHLLPNVIPQIVVIGTFAFSQMVVVEASLSFLGLGIQPPTPTWGQMLADARSYIDTAWWYAAFPGLALVSTVLAINLVGDWLRDIVDPFMRVRE